MKVQIVIEFNSVADAAQWYEKDQNVVWINQSKVLTVIEFLELKYTIKHLKETYNVIDLHLYFDETEF